MSRITTAKIGCDSFDQPNMRLLNDCNFLFFGLTTTFLGIWRHVIYRWKVLEDTFLTVYYMPRNLIKTQSQKKQKIAVV